MDIPIGMVADNLTERGHPILAPIAALTLAVGSGKIVEPHLGRLLRRGGAAAARHGKKAAGDIMDHLKAAADASLDRTGSGATRPIAPKKPPEKVNIPPVSGNEAKVVTPGIRKGVAAKYEAVDAADIQASHKHDTFAKNPKYPKGVQERRYHDDPTEQYKVIDNAQNPEMRYLVTDNPDAINGPPIVTKDGVVLGGNSRAMTIQRMYSDHPENAAAYKETVRRNAERFGLDPDKVAGMGAPVLVRRTGVGDNKKSMTRLVSEFNRPPTHGMDEAAQTASRGRNLSARTIAKIGDRLAQREVSLRKMLDTKEGKSLLNDLARDGVIAENEVNRYINAKYNQLNAQGKTLVEQTVLGSIIDDPDLLAVAPKSLVNKLGRSLSPLARLKARGGEWDITPNIKEAFELAVKVSGSGKKSVDAYFQQMGLFGGVTYSPRSVRLAKTLLENTSLEIKKRLDSFAAGANIDTKGQAKMFAPPSADDLFEQSFGRIDPDQGFSAVAEQKGLFGAPAQSKPFDEVELNDIPRQKQKASATFGPARRVSHATGRGRNNAKSVLPPGGDDALGLHNRRSRSTVFVSTGRIRRGPTHLRGPGEAAALVSNLRNFAQEKFFIIAVDEDGKILNLHRYSVGTKGEANVNTVEIAGITSRIPGVKKVYAVHNHPARTPEPSGGERRKHPGDIEAMTRLGSALKLSGIDADFAIVAGDKFAHFDTAMTLASNRPTLVKNTVGDISPLRDKSKRHFERERYIRGGGDPSAPELRAPGDTVSWARINAPGKGCPGRE